jgi:hypothetical protein
MSTTGFLTDAVDVLRHHAVNREIGDAAAVAAATAYVLTGEVPLSLGLDVAALIERVSPALRDLDAVDLGGFVEAYDAAVDFDRFGR